ncbi:hypothetical protein [Sphingobium sp.]|nr:hypothetical protein [Sphingobium sp.]
MAGWIMDAEKTAVGVSSSKKNNKQRKPDITPKAHRLKSFIVNQM